MPVVLLSGRLCVLGAPNGAYETLPEASGRRVGKEQEQGAGRHRLRVSRDAGSVKYWSALLRYRLVVFNSLFVYC